MTSGQFLALMFVAVFPTMAMLLPGDLIRLAGRYGWWTPLLAGVPAMVGAWLTGALVGRLGDSISAAMHGLGPVVGRAILLVEWLAVGAFMVVIIRESGEISGATLVTASIPVWMLAVLSVVPAVLLVWFGPVVLGRTAALIVPILVFMYLMVIVAILPSAHVIWALPIIPRDTRFASWQPLVRTWVWEAEPIFLGAMLMNSAQRTARKSAGRTLGMAIAASAILTALGTWTAMAEDGPRGAAAEVLPILTLINRVTFTSAVQHLQSVVLPIETMGTILKVAVFLLVWSRLGQRIVGGWRNLVLAVEVLVGTSLAVGLFSNVLAVDRATYYWLARWALPAVCVATCIGYGAAAIQRARSRA